METDNHNVTDDFSCPVCKARQGWADTCRRCKTDLRLFRRVEEAFRQSRLRTLAHLRAGRWTEALAEARQCYALDANADAGRLLAVCQLLSGDWPAALALARRWS
jgi:ribosomal protein L40E